MVPTKLLLLILAAVLSPAMDVSVLPGTVVAAPGPVRASAIRTAIDEAARADEADTAAPARLTRRSVATAVVIDAAPRVVRTDRPLPPPAPTEPGAPRGPPAA